MSEELGQTQELGLTQRKDFCLHLAAGFCFLYSPSIFRCGALMPRTIPAMHSTVVEKLFYIRSSPDLTKRAAGYQ